MTQVPLPEPAGIVVGEERGYSDWFHIIRWDCRQNMPKGTKFFLEEGLHEFAAVVSAAKDVEIERLRGYLRKSHGYAAGNYMNKCLHCGTQMEWVDKRCYVCAECADKRTDAALKGTP